MHNPPSRLSNFSRSHPANCTKARRNPGTTQTSHDHDAYTAEDKTISASRTIQTHDRYSTCDNTGCETCHCSYDGDFPKPQVERFHGHYSFRSKPHRNCRSPTWPGLRHRANTNYYHCE